MIFHIRFITWGSKGIRSAAKFVDDKISRTFNCKNNDGLGIKMETERNRPCISRLTSFVKTEEILPFFTREFSFFVIDGRNVSPFSSVFSPIT